MSIYIISDLHLKPSDLKAFESFKSLLNDIAQPQNTLFILGDFFEYWIGDDNLDPFYQKVTLLLKNATNNDFHIYFMHGNRDFLVGKQFAKQSGVQLISDPYYLTWQGKKVLLTHGDLLCTTDRSYLRYRYLVQSRLFKWLFLHLPLSIRLKIAKKMRAHSSQRGPYVLDVDATDKGLKQYAKNCDIVIHGHTHKLNIHHHGNLARYVLSDWHGSRYSYIKLDNEITLKDSNA
ncbi:UDP-2,3-diacylglucosamine diphosphatase [Thiotrichales bacterium 19S11-10]|nr:UDP-2,3-diacylglucosamine diphosphatase [Thiotrichales bacterium 19S11-10]